MSIAKPYDGHKSHGGLKTTGVRLSASNPVKTLFFDNLSTRNYGYGGDPHLAALGCRYRQWSEWNVGDHQMRQCHWGFGNYDPACGEDQHHRRL